jgi:hypothetical protein
MPSRKRRRDTEAGAAENSAASLVRLLPNLLVPFPKELHGNNTAFRGTTDLREFGVTPEAWGLIAAYRWARLQAGHCATVEEQLPAMRKSLLECGPALVAHQYLFPNDLAPHAERFVTSLTGVFVEDRRNDYKPTQLTSDNACQLFPFHPGSKLNIDFNRGCWHCAHAPQEAVLRKRLEQADPMAEDWTAAALLRLMLSGDLFAPGEHEGEEVLFQHSYVEECVYLSVSVHCSNPDEHSVIDYTFAADASLFDHLKN